MKFLCFLKSTLEFQTNPNFESASYLFMKQILFYINFLFFGSSLSAQSNTEYTMLKSFACFAFEQTGFMDDCTDLNILASIDINKTEKKIDIKTIKTDSYTILQKNVDTTDNYISEIYLLKDKTNQYAKLHVQNINGKKIFTLMLCDAKAKILYKDGLTTIWKFKE